MQIKKMAALLGGAIFAANCYADHAASGPVTKHLIFSHIKAGSQAVTQEECQIAFTDGDVIENDYGPSSKPQDFKISDALVIKNLKMDNPNEPANAKGMVHHRWSGEAHIKTKDGEKIADFTGSADMKKGDEISPVHGKMGVAKTVNGTIESWCSADLIATKK